MKKLNIASFGISNTIVVSAVVVLVTVASIGFGLYGISAQKGATSETMTTTTGMTENQTNAYAFTPKAGSMLSSAWILSVPIGMHDYAVSVHAEGLE